MAISLADATSDWFVLALFQIAVVARAAGLQVIDGPHFKLHDPDGLQGSCRRSAALVLPRQWAVHPEQLPLINVSYTPDQTSFDAASELVDLYDKAAGDQKVGAVTYKGEMIDEANRKVALRTVTRGKQAGMVPSVGGGAPT